MPITPTNTATTFGGMPSGMPMTTGLPNFSLPDLSAKQVDPSKMAYGQAGSPYADIFSLLSNAPSSLTSTIMPYIQSLFNNQSSAGVAGAQSDAMARGLTGSSIEESGIQQARSSASTNFIQSIIPVLMGAGQFDINNTQGYYGNLAQASGQAYGQQLGLSEFMQQLFSGNQQANQIASNEQLAGWLGLGGAALGAGGRLGAAAIGSDIRLKEDVKLLGIFKGHKWYSFKYRQDTKFKLPVGIKVGILAHEVAKTNPKAVMVKEGYLWVDYRRLLHA